MRVHVDKVLEGIMGGHVMAESFQCHVKVMTLNGVNETALSRFDRLFPGDSPFHSQPQPRFGSFTLSKQRRQHVESSCHL